MHAMRKPRPITGRVRPDPGDANAQARAERAEEVVETIWVDTDRQRAILNALRRYMRRCRADRRPGRSITGRRLSQHSQAGKSAIAEQLIRELEEEIRAKGGVINPYRVIHINIDQRMSLKMLLQEILNRLGDEFPAEPDDRSLRVTPEQAKEIRGRPTDTIKVLEQRIEKWVVKLNVELIIVDEIQRLVTRPEEEIDPKDPANHLTTDAMDVTKKLQAFLDRGVVPLFFIGDDHSPKFFALNTYFAARLLKPLELSPLNPGKTTDRKQFFDFCIGYDREIRKRKLTSVPTCLTEPGVLAGLITASAGHVGRAARIIQVALPAALERGAVTLEPFDLSNAVRNYAMDLGWVDHDPFSVASFAPTAPIPDEAPERSDGD